jgi:hypothetical protein
VAGRELAFSDAEIIRLAKNEFVPVAGDDWYQRRRQDAEGEFFRKVADQGPRKGVGGSTRQGIYVVTADGNLLAFRNAQDPDLMRQVLRQGLKAYQQLPSERRRPGAVQVAELGRVDQRYSRKPPAGAVVLNVYTRILDRDDKGKMCHGSCKFPGGDKTAHDHMWLTAAEVQALVPAGARVGDSFPLPKAIAWRLLRFHLVDNTRGEPPFWSREQVRESDLRLRVEDVSDKGVRLQLVGHAVLSTNADERRADRGFDVHLLGTVEFDARKARLVRFDVVAVGDHWGEGTFTGGARPGRTPLGVALEIAEESSPGRDVPPQGAREITEYLRTGT